MTGPHGGHHVIQEHSGENIQIRSDMDVKDKLQLSFGTLQSRQLELAPRTITAGRHYVRHCIGPGQAWLPQGSLALLTSPGVLSFDNTGSRIWRSVKNENSL